MNKSSALILAGGRGQRMGVLCRNKPKPALPFGGRYRVIDFSLSNCLNSQINNIAVLTGFQRSYLGNYLKRWNAINAPKRKISVLEPRNGSYQGTADAVYQNLIYLSRKDSDNVLVLAADHVYKMDYRKMIDFHQAANADATVAVIEVPIESAHQYGNVETRSDGQIISFVEKPRRPESNLVSMGIYVFSRMALIERLIEDALTPGSIHDFGHVILPRMVKHNRVYAYQFNDYWQDIGTPEAYHRANLDSLYTNSILKINSEWPLYSACKRMYQPLVNKGKIVVSNNNIISPGCVIKGTVKNSVLSPGVWVGEDAVIQNSVIMPDASIGRGARVINSILDEGAAIGEYCKIGKMSVDHSSVTVVGQNIRVPSFSEVLTGGDRILNPEPVVFPSFELENILQRKFDSALT